MVTVKALLRDVLRLFLAIRFSSRQSIKILAGPMKGRELPKGLALENIAMVFGRYEPLVVSELATITGTGSVAYDIGSHFGFMTLVLASRVGHQGKVMAIEPVPDNLANLKEVLLLNGLNRVVSVLPKAVSDTVGELSMVLRTSSYTHFLQKATQGQDEALYRKITVEAVTIDSLVLEQGYPAPNLLKIDVEGSESLVVEGALATLRLYSPTLLIEIHGPAQATKLWELLHCAGYAWWRLTPKGLTPVRSQGECIAPFFPKAWTHHYLVRR